MSRSDVTPELKKAAHEVGLWKLTRSMLPSTGLAAMARRASTVP